MAFRNVGPAMRSYTTAQLTALVAKFGPTGTQEANAIRPGTLVYDSTLNKLKLFTGSDFVLVTSA